jgi:hypothetical protein
VEYVIVGGVAANIHGAERGLDFVRAEASAGAQGHVAIDDGWRLPARL